MLDKNVEPSSLLDGENLVEKIGATSRLEDVNLDGLPKMLWLRGDEPHFELFDLDADKVMELLGIKRSRLNQISGKELRVARKRDGRYVRPFYRKEDVQEYLEWTRSTVTHKRSSEVVDSAAKALSAKAEHLSDEFRGLKSTIEAKLQKEFHSGSQNLYGCLKAFHQMQTMQIEKCQKGVLDIERHMQTSFASFQNLLDRLEKSQHDSTQEVAALSRGISELLSTVQLQTQWLRDHGEHLRAMQNQLQQDTVKHNQGLQQLEAKMNALQEQLVAPEKPQRLNPRLRLRNKPPRGSNKYAKLF